MVSLTRRKFCLICSPLFGRNTKNILSDPRTCQHKVCPRCNTDKDKESFYIRRDGRLSPYCIRCHSDESLERQVAFKKRAIEYKGGCCSKCGFSGHPACFDFHHRDRLKKRFEISKCKRSAWDRVVSELDACDLVCANCHRVIEVTRPRIVNGSDGFATNEEVASSNLAGGTIYDISDIADGGAQAEFWPTQRADQIIGRGGTARPRAM